MTPLCTFQISVYKCPKSLGDLTHWRLIGVIRQQCSEDGIRSALGYLEQLDDNCNVSSWLCCHDQHVALPHLWNAASALILSCPLTILISQRRNVCVAKQSSLESRKRRDWQWRLSVISVSSQFCVCSQTPANFNNLISKLFSLPLSHKTIAVNHVSVSRDEATVRVIFDSGFMLGSGQLRLTSGSADWCISTQFCF